MLLVVVGAGGAYGYYQYQQTSVLRAELAQANAGLASSTQNSVQQGSISYVPFVNQREGIRSQIPEGWTVSEETAVTGVYYMFVTSPDFVSLPPVGGMGDNTTESGMRIKLSVATSSPEQEAKTEAELLQRIEMHRAGNLVYVDELTEVRKQSSVLVYSVGKVRDGFWGTAHLYKDGYAYDAYFEFSGKLGEAENILKTFMTGIERL
ncbi:MAG: hypothetical protein KA066_02755 [Candidatus Pacebacteria bacterium]|nr:hypothetical protein [Candidatus Paceibacterota bacterium]